ncbi:MAG: DUF917 domain-containing protein [Brevinema sp.]
MRYIDEQALEEIAIGAAVLGTGGGGDPYIGKLIAQQAVRHYGPVVLLDPDEIDDNAVCISSSGMGAPTVMVEKIPAQEEFLAPFETLEKIIGKKADIVFPIECGGINSMLPFVVAAQKGLPIVDADGMGRAFPELQMTVFHLFGCQISPMVLGDCRLNTVYLNTVDDLWAEKLARALTIQMGGQVSMGDTVLTGKQLKEYAILNPIKLSQEIGKTILNAHLNVESPTDSVLKVSGGYDLFYGKVVDITRSTNGAFVLGKAILEGIGRDKGKTAVMEFQNENLVIRVNNKVIASVPDLICNLEIHTGLPITTEGLKFGQRMMVLGLKSDEKWRSDKGIQTVGPRAFGYDFDYQAIEDIWRHS